jgi:predicted TIM-barrel fold metal-dependent hydrolase
MTTGATQAAQQADAPPETAVHERLIDSDSHIIEPPDLWTSRMPTKWADEIPHVRFDNEAGEDIWFIGDRALSAFGHFAMVGWGDVWPSYPPRIEDVADSTYDGAARLRLLDEVGIHAQVFYPNLIGGFFAHELLRMDPALALACLKAYNDFVTDFSSPDQERLIGLTALPFWDVHESVREMERGQTAGHRGVLFAHSFELLGLPNINDEHWHPILDAAQSLGQSINLHVGFSVYANRSGRDLVAETRAKSRVDSANGASLGFLSNARAINLLTLFGVCDRYPDLKFVAVESGFGFVPYQLQALDWQWENNGLRGMHPGRLKPSDCFRRQIYATMWFERPPPEQLDEWQDNVMWETDFPHPTAQWPTPTSSVALSPSEAVDYSLGGVSREARAKIVCGNATKLYRLS